MKASHCIETHLRHSLGFISPGAPSIQMNCFWKKENIPPHLCTGILIHLINRNWNIATLDSNYILCSTSHNTVSQGPSKVGIAARGLLPTKRRAEQALLGGPPRQGWGVPSWSRAPTATAQVPREGCLRFSVFSCRVNSATWGMPTPCLCQYLGWRETPDKLPHTRTYITLKSTRCGKRPRAVSVSLLVTACESTLISNWNV